MKRNEKKELGEERQVQGVVGVKRYVIGAALLLMIVGYSGISSDTWADRGLFKGDVPNDFVVVSKGTVNREEMVKVRESDTGCYFVVYKGESKQVFTEEGGLSVPSCD